MSGKNRYERTKSIFVGIICLILFFISSILAILAFTNKTPERKVYERELKSIKEQTKTKKANLDELTKTINELEQQKIFVEQALSLYEEQMDPISNRVTQFESDGTIYYCFRDKTALKSTADKSLQSCGITWPKDPFFDLNKNWYKTDNYSSSVKSNMALYKMPYAYKEEIKISDKTIKYIIYFYHLDEKNIMYKQIFTYSINIS